MSGPSFPLLAQLARAKPKSVAKNLSLFFSFIPLARECQKFPTFNIAKYLTMKKILLSLFLFIAITASAQTFEGTITWSVKYEMTDPANQAELERSHKAMSDPANQEKMKKMRDQMNTPEMKALLEKNPQMKTQMENALKMIEGGGGNSILPKSFVVKSKGNHTLTKMEGGMMPMEMLYLPEKNQAYMLNRNAKTYSLLPSGNDAANKRDSLRYKVIKTSETRKILNYTCTKTIVELTTDKGALNQVFWTSTDIKGIDMRSLSRQRMGGGNQSFYYEGISGVPLRMEMLSAQMNMVMEVIDIKKESLPAAEFTIPADYKETKGFMQ